MLHLWIRVTQSIRQLVGFCLIGFVLTGLWLQVSPQAFADDGSSSPSSDATIAIPHEIGDGGAVRIDGSPSMSVINQLLKQQVEQEYPGLDVELQTHGTDAALESLLADEIDLAAIARPLSAEEKARGLIEIPVSQDRIALIIGRSNPFDGDLTLEEFSAIRRGEVTHWSQVGGPDRPIRFIDRPETSDTRRVLNQYLGISNAASSGDVATLQSLKTDDTAEVIRQLGMDGISYALAHEVQGQTNVKLVKVAVLLDTLPEDAIYPYEQPRGYAYKQDNSSVLPFLNVATADTAQQAIATARSAEAQAVATALKPPSRLAWSTAAGQSGTTPPRSAAEEEQAPVWTWGWLLLALLPLLPLVFRRQPIESDETGESVPPSSTPVPDRPSSRDTADIAAPSIAAVIRDAVWRESPSRRQDEVDEGGGVADGGGSSDAETAEDGGLFAAIAPDAVVEAASESPAIPSEAVVEAVAESTAIAPDAGSESVSAAMPDAGCEAASEEDGEPAAIAPGGDVEGAIAQPQPEPHVLYEQALHDLEANRDGEALDCLEQATVGAPDWMLLWLLKGNTLLKLGRYQEAIASFDRAIALHDEHPSDDPASIVSAWLGKGQALLKVGRPQIAFDSFAQVIQRQPDLPDAWVGQGSALVMLGQTAEAQVSYARASQLRQGVGLPETAGEASAGEPDDLGAVADLETAGEPDISDREATTGSAKVGEVASESEGAFDRAIAPPPPEWLEPQTDRSRFEGQPVEPLAAATSTELTAEAMAPATDVLRVDMVMLADASLSPEQAKALSAASDLAVQSAIAHRPADVRLVGLAIREAVPGTDFDRTVRDYLVGECGVAAESLPDGRQGPGAIAIQTLSTCFNWREGASRSIFYVGDAADDSPTAIEAIHQATQQARDAGVIVHTYVGVSGRTTPTPVADAYARLARDTGGLAFPPGEAERGFQEMVQQSIENSCRRCGHRRLVVNSRRDCYRLDEAQIQALQSTANSAVLQPGDYVIRIREGAFGYGGKGASFDLEPWIVLWVYGGRFINKRTQADVGATWVVLNGSTDALLLKVIERTTVSGLFFDTFRDDNQGQVTLSILQIDPE